MNSPVLLVGNSPNQVRGAGRSWGELLCILRQHARLDANDETHKSKPFPLHYEEIRNRYLAVFPDQTELQFAELVAQLFSDLKPNDIHKRLMALPFQDVLTTNYDSCLEQAVANTPKKANFGITERSYSLFRRIAVGNKHIWHLRGEVKRPQSIVLGQDRYVEACSRLRRYMDGDGVEFSGKEPVKAAFKSDAPFDPVTPHSWVDMFLSRDVHIVGFGMDYTEADIWYLLSYRARKHRTRADWVERMRRTKVTIHAFIDPNKPIEIQQNLKQKHEVLRSFGVELIEYSLLNSSYEEQWDRILVGLAKVGIS